MFQGISRRLWLPILGALAVLGALALAVAPIPPSVRQAGQQKGVPGAERFYYLTAPLQRALQSQPVLWGPSLEKGAFRERVVLITFFASWCIPCRMEMAELKKLHRELGGRSLQIVAVNYFEDFDGYSNPKKLAAFLESIDPTFPVVKGSDGLSQAFGEISRIPTLLVFDRAGRQVFRFYNRGPDNAALDAEFLRKVVTTLL